MSSHGGIMSYSLLEDKYPDFSNPNSSDNIWKEYFSGIPKNGFGKKWNISVKNGELVVSSDVRKYRDCEEIKKEIQGQVSNVQCEGTILKVYFNDGN